MQIPAERLSFAEHARRPFAAMLRFQRSIELARGLRTSSRSARRRSTAARSAWKCTGRTLRAAGESDARIDSVAVWRESPLYAERERAALELCEAMTLVADTRVPDGVW